MATNGSCESAGRSRSEIGVCAALFGDLPFEEAFSRLADAGVGALDLELDTYFRLFRDIAPFDENATRKLELALEEYDFEPVCVGNCQDVQLLLGPHGPHTDPICKGTATEKRAHAKRRIDETLRVAQALGTRLVRFFFGCPDYALWLPWSGTEMSWRDNVRALAAELRPIIRDASDRGLTVLIEPHPKQVVYDAHTTSMLFDELKSDADGLGICFDAANLASIGADPVEYARAFGERISLVHLKDVEFWTASHPPKKGSGWVAYGPQSLIRFRSVPWGTLDWRAIWSALCESGFRGPMVLENQDVLIDRDRGLAQALDFAESIAAVRPPNPRWW